MTKIQCDCFSLNVMVKSIDQKFLISQYSNRIFKLCVTSMKYVREKLTLNRQRTNLTHLDKIL